MRPPISSASVLRTRRANEPRPVSPGAVTWAGCRSALAWRGGSSAQLPCAPGDGQGRGLSSGLLPLPSSECRSPLMARSPSCSALLPLASRSSVLLAIPRVKGPHRPASVSRTSPERRIGMWHAARAVVAPMERFDGRARGGSARWRSLSYSFPSVTAPPLRSGCR
jgi:hypothetical protein